MKRKRNSLRSGGWALAAIVFGAAEALAWPGGPASWGVGAGVPLTIAPVSYGYDEPFDPWFVDPLDGHGEWVHVRSVGGPVWFPFVEVAWRPYVHGHWAYTTLGMMWVSYEPWGRLTHHYGRWVYLDGYGWGWVPGREYGPAWVTWVVVDGYVGWAPLPPDGFFYPRRTRYHYAGPRVVFGRPVSRTTVEIDINLFVFVSNRHFHGTDIHVHALPGVRSVEFFRKKEVVPIGRALEIEHVRGITRERVNPVRVERRSYRSGDHRVVDYEPVGQGERIRKAREGFARRETIETSRKKSNGDVRLSDEWRAGSEPPAARAERGAGSAVKRDSQGKSRSEPSAIKETKNRPDEKSRPAAEKKKEKGSSGTGKSGKSGKESGTSKSEKSGKSAESRGSGDSGKKKR
ncbi:MAG: DUF6600 domain-containing protein [Candidatus Eisenbacteria bacterium]